MTKRVDVAKLVTKVNYILRRPDTEVNTPESRRLLMIFIEDVLHETGNYHGFQYLTEDEMIPKFDGTVDAPGMLWEDRAAGKVKYHENGRLVTPDETRIQYF